MTARVDTADGDHAATPATGSSGTDSAGAETDATLDASNPDESVDDIETVDPSALDTLSAPRPVTIRPLDFRNPAPPHKQIEAAILDSHGRYVDQVAAVFTMLFGERLKGSVRSIDTVRVSRYRHVIGDSAFFASIRIDQHGQRYFIEWSQPLVFAFIEKSLGGKGAFTRKDRAPTAIESGIFRELAERFVTPSVATLYRPNAKHHLDFRSDPNKIEFGRATDVLVHVGFDVTLGEDSGTFSIAHPITDWPSGQIGDQTETEIDPLVRESMQQALGGAAIELRAELGQARMSLSDLAHIGVGDVIRLDRRVGENIIIAIGKHRRFAAEPGERGAKRAIRVTRALEEADG